MVVVGVGAVCLEEKFQVSHALDTLWSFEIELSVRILVQISEVFAPFFSFEIESPKLHWLPGNWSGQRFNASGQHTPLTDLFLSI